MCQCVNGMGMARTRFVVGGVLVRMTVPQGPDSEFGGERIRMHAGAMEDVESIMKTSRGGWSCCECEGLSHVRAFVVCISERV